MFLVFEEILSVMYRNNCLFMQELVARFVSLIPFVSDSVIVPGLCDIWSTCDVSKMSWLGILITL